MTAYWDFCLNNIHYSRWTIVPVPSLPNPLYPCWCTSTSSPLAFPSFACGHFHIRHIELYYQPARNYKLTDSVFLAFLILISMAKTKGRSEAGPSSSPYPYVLLVSFPPPPNPTGHSLRSRPRRSSPSIVAFLATLSASHFSVHAHPLDPPQTAFPFLYPSFIHHPTPSVAKRSLPSSADATTGTSSLPPTPKCTPGQAAMPDNYVLGDDGLWHKTGWSLYGSTQCSVSNFFLLTPPPRPRFSST